MLNPMKAPDKYNYERSAIESWVKNYHKSPLTNQEMEIDQLHPNKSLRKRIIKKVNEVKSKGENIVDKIPVTIPKPKEPSYAESLEELKSDQKYVPPLKVDPEKRIDFVQNWVLDIDGQDYLHLSIVPQKEGKRTPCAFICIVDVSSSMYEADPSESEVEDVGYSRLDIVKHSLKTVVNLLEDQDYLAIITFSGTSKVYLKLCSMNSAGKKESQKMIDNMKPNGQTNIWAGLNAGIDLITSNPICKDVTTSIMLFTDGESNMDPKSGIIKSLIKKLNGATPFYSMNTFGFGYNMDSRILFDISKIGHGINCYLPVCNLVGTTFVNCVCNFLSTAVDRVSIELLNCKIEGIKCIGYEMKGNNIDVGTVNYGQTRDFIIQVPKGVTIKPVVNYYAKDGKRRIDAREIKDNLLFSKAYSRCFYNEMLLKGLNRYNPSKPDLKFLNDISDIISSSPSKNEPDMQALLRDITSPVEAEGRVTKAFSTKERVKRWGGHYVRSIIRAHQLQVCHNFKDPGVQLYGGSLFKELRNKADMIFCNLPPAVPSRKKVVNPPPPPATAAKTQYIAPVAALRVDMQDFYSGGGGGCFDGEGQVRMADCTFKNVKQLVKGDKILDSAGTIAKVICLVEFPVKKPVYMVTLNGLKITRTHPVFHEGSWRYPRAIGDAKLIYCDSIYNLVLDKNHVANINGLDVVTLGHEKKNNEFVKHSYYGSDKVIQDLKAVRGWNEGYILMEQVKKFKDPLTGKVIGFH